MSMEYLEQSGIPGMRWYVKNGPPYPLSRKDHNRVVKKAKGKKKEGLISEMKEKAATKKRAKKRAAALAKARAARAEKAKKDAYEKKLEADKERVLKSGSATELTKYKGRLTNKELQDAWNRLELEAKILSKAEAENVKPDKVKEFFDNVDKYTKYVKSGTEAANASINAYDTFVDVYNKFATPSKPMTKIRGNNDKKDDEGGKKNKNNSISKDELESLLKKYSNANVGNQNTNKKGKK